ncbi:MAG: uroporphyrinogen-III synthase [Bacteroidia bacterium]|nr:uroporphyrinogen-III synthase [Bacteroidia bacterium]
MKVKTILVSQPKPESDKSPYFDLEKNYNVKVDFRPFIHVEGIDVKDFRKTKIDLSDRTAVILTSRSAADHFFRIHKDLRLSGADGLKYFCISEAVALYLQKYIVYRKRKIFHGTRTFDDLLTIIKKHKKEAFLLPCSNIHKQQISKLLTKESIDFKKAVLYKTICSDLSDLADIKYDMLVFFSPSGVKSLYKNFPKFKQNSTRIAAFGPTTSKAVLDAGLKLDIKAPIPDAPSMTMSIEHYLKKVNKRR